MVLYLQLCARTQGIWVQSPTPPQTRCTILDKPLPDSGKHLRAVSVEMLSRIGALIFQFLICKTEAIIRLLHLCLAYADCNLLGAGTASYSVCAQCLAQQAILVETSRPSVIHIHDSNYYREIHRATL